MSNLINPTTEKHKINIEERKVKFDLNRIKTLISVRPDKNIKNQEDDLNIINEGIEPSEIAVKNIKKNKLGKSKIKSLKNTLLRSSYRMLRYVGNVDDARKHENANRPLKRIKKFDSKTSFCKCCGLPCKEKGVMEEYKYSDSTDLFIQNGQAISLYFSFYLYSIFILLIAFISISLPSLIISYNRSHELNKICNQIYKEKNIEECKIYVDNIDDEEEENKSSFNFILDFSGINIKNYRIIHMLLTSNNNKNLDKIFVNYSVLNFVGISTILLIYFGYTILVNNKDYIPDIDILSPKNYSIMISGLDGFYSYLKSETNFLSIAKDSQVKEDKGEGTQTSEREESIDDKSITGVQKFENLFKEKLSEIFLNKEQKFNIKKVNVCFKINKYIKLEEKLEECNEALSLIYTPYQKKKNFGVSKSERIYYYSPFSDFDIHICEKTKKLSDMNKEKKEIEDKIKELFEETKKVNMEKFAGAVIISFNTIKEKEEFLSYVPKSLVVQLLKIIGTLRYLFCFCCIKKIDNSPIIMKTMKIKIEEAPDPEDIIFENLEFKPHKKFYRILGINTISILLIAIGFGIILALQNLQIYVNKKNYNRVVYYIISICITIVSSIINIIFEELLDMLTKIEKQSSITKYYLSYSIKLTIFSFLTKGIIPLVVEEISGTENYEILITNMLTMFLANSVVTPLIWTLNINPVIWKKKLNIYLIEKNPYKYLNMNQKKLNQLYEKNDMKISEKYSYIAKTLLMTFFYISIFPFGVLISLGGFILCFFLEKYNYINNYKRPEILNNTLFFFYLKNYIIILFFIGLGDYIFLSDVFSTKAWSLANLIILAALIVIPFNYFLECDFIGFKESEINKIKYDEAYFEFHNDYERINPMTRKEGIKNYLEKLCEKKLITREKKEKLLSDIESINLMKVYYENRNYLNNIKAQKAFVSLDQRSLSKSFLPTAKNYFKLSNIYSSFIDFNNKEKAPKKNQSQILNSFNFNQESGQNKENDKEKDKNDLPPVKFENIPEVDSYKEDEIDSDKLKLSKNNGILEIKSDKNKEGNMKKFRENLYEFYKDPLNFKVYGSMQVYNLIKGDKNNNKEIYFGDNEEFENEDDEDYEEEENDENNKNNNEEKIDDKDENLKVEK